MLGLLAWAVASCGLVACDAARTLGNEVLARPTAHSAPLQSLEVVIRDARAGGDAPAARYEVPAPEQLARLRAFSASFARGAGESPPAPFTLVRVDGRSGLVALRSGELGAGVYALRTRDAAGVFVAVPHSFWDTHTLPIGRALFEALHARALLVNTVHRYRGAGCPLPDTDDDGQREPCASDVAHAPASAFQAVHEGLCTAYPAALTVAVHGFTRKEHDPDVILSAAGTKADLGPLRRTLSTLYGAERVRSFPQEIKRLGGMTSVQARFLRRTGGPMLHIELSRQLRDLLQANAAALAKFARAVTEALGPAYPRSQAKGEASGRRHR